MTNAPKQCLSCNTALPIPRGARQQRCKPCASKWKDQHRSEYYKEHKRLHRKTNKYNESVRRKKLRLEAIEKYGGCCACCGESEYNFMAIDHINGGGNKHLKEIGVHSGAPFMAWLKRQGWPEEYRVLCHNCNMSRGFYGYCPHERFNT